VEAGSEIGVHYDPLLAKVIAHAPDREHAQQKLVYALNHFAVLGVETNREFLIDVLESEEFRSGKGHTGFQLEPKKHGEHHEVFAAVAQAYALHSERASREILPSIAVRWGRESGHRVVGSSGQPKTQDLLTTKDTEEHKGKQNTGNRQQATGHREDKIQILKVSDETVEALVDGVHHHLKVRAEDQCLNATAGESRTFYIWSALGQRTVVLPERYPRREGVGERQTANSPMPGQVLRILVIEGQQVKTGQALITLEAMKMEQTIKATLDGVVGKVLVKQGEIVAPGQKLVEIIG
jgi:acetyl/propionyl-CoA carboxylase alpha subunit